LSPPWIQRNFVEKSWRGLVHLGWWREPLSQVQLARSSNLEQGSCDAAPFYRPSLDLLSLIHCNRHRAPVSYELSLLNCTACALRTKERFA
jgi:hypothetical protein